MAPGSYDVVTGAAQAHRLRAQPEGARAGNYFSDIVRDEVVSPQDEVIWLDVARDQMRLSRAMTEGPGSMLTTIIALPAAPGDPHYLFTSMGKGRL